jgi:transcription initiation factor TFIIH subunit 3
MTDDLNPSLLVLIIDCSPMLWRQRNPTSNTVIPQTLIDFETAIKSIIFYLNSYALMHRENRLVVIATHPDKNTVIYPRRNEIDNNNNNNNSNNNEEDNFIPILHFLSSIISNALIDIANTKVEIIDSSTKSLSNSTLSQALSTSLCIINRQLKLNPKLQPRIVTTQIGKDDSKSYNSVMNSIFSAQKIGVPVDALILSKEDSPFLQQACLITNGIYLHPLDQRDILQLLLTHCLASLSTRYTLECPIQKIVDFKASCFCHQKSVEFAFMCTVCLALTCEVSEVCSTCNTKVKKAKLK